MNAEIRSGAMRPVILIPLVILVGYLLNEFCFPDLKETLWYDSVDNKIGALTIWLTHSSWAHLVSNIIGIFVFLCLNQILFFRSDNWQLYTVLIFGSGLTLHMIHQYESAYTGASGFLFSLAYYFLVMLFKTKKVQYMLGACLILVLQRGLITSLVPTEIFIAWDAHLAGALWGISVGFIWDRMKI